MNFMATLRKHFAKLCCDNTRTTNCWVACNTNFQLFHCTPPYQTYFLRSAIRRQSTSPSCKPFNKISAVPIFVARGYDTHRINERALLHLARVAALLMDRGRKTPYPYRYWRSLHLFAGHHRVVQNEIAEWLILSPLECAYLLFL